MFRGLLAGVNHQSTVDGWLIYWNVQNNTLYEKWNPLKKINYSPVVFVLYFQSVWRIDERPVAERRHLMEYCLMISAFISYPVFLEARMGVKVYWWNLLKTVKLIWINKMACGALLIDLSKAFDCLPYRVIKSKLRACDQRRSIFQMHVA